MITDTTMIASGLAQRCVDQLAAANIPATVFRRVSRTQPMKMSATDSRYYAKRIAIS